MSLSELITINGVELRSILPEAHVINIVVGAVEHEHEATARVIHPGSFFGRSRPGMRSVKVSFELPWDKENAIMNYGKLLAWAKSEQPVIVRLPNSNDRYLKCIFSSASELDLNQWYMPVEISFVAYDPYFYSRFPKKQAVGETIYNAGSVAVPYRIEVTLSSAVSNPQWLLDGVTKIALSGSVGAGSLVIDTANESVRLNGESIAAQLTLDSRFIDLSPGKHTITGTAATIHWTEGWE